MEVTRWRNNAAPSQLSSVVHTRPTKRRYSVPSPSNMSGKTALITGAAAGLGRATALILADAGANLCLLDINAGGLQSTADEARARGVEVLPLAVDIGEPQNCRDAVA